MTDQTPPEGTDGAAGGQPKFQVLPITIVAQYLKDLSFENPNAPMSLTASQAAPRVAVDVDVQSRQAGEYLYEVTLSLRATASAQEQTVFLVEVAYGGLLQVKGVPREQLAPVVMIEGPRQLFPFARAIVAAVTRDGGYPPLLINPIDFVDLFRRQMARQAQEAQKASDGAAGAA